MSKPRFTLTLEANTASDAEAYRLLRLSLKQLLRAYGMRCVDARQLSQGTEPHANQTTQSPLR